jgi:ABC-type transport system involved in multi-copper enzyme maturation permease subunit
MTMLLSAELLKLRTLRSTWVVAAVAVVLSAVIGVAGTLAPGAAHRPDLHDLVVAPAQPVFFLVVLLAVLASAGEFQHRTVRTTLLAAPRRGRVLAAKAAVSAAGGAALVLAGTTAAVVAGVLTAGRPFPAASWSAVGALVGSLALGAVWAAVAVGLGVLTRSTAAAVVAVLLWRFVGEGVLPVVTRSPGISRWTPSGAGDALLGLGGGDRLAVAPAALVLAGYVAVVVAASAAQFVRRDAT